VRHDRSRAKKNFVFITEIPTIWNYQTKNGEHVTKALSDAFATHFMVFNKVNRGKILGKSYAYATFYLDGVKKNNYKYSVDFTNAVKANEMVYATNEKVVVPIGLSTADELKKWKDLLDSGAITKEEYEVKKKKILE
jgi:hypothetical protein